MSEQPERIGPYRIDRLLGRGGMGVVYRAVRDGAGDVVALKVLGAGMGEDESALRRFELELAALERLRHPSVIAARGPLGRDGGHVFFPLEYVEGSTLRQVLDVDGALPLGKAVRLARSLFEALDAAHSVGVVHRDVKPSNILLPAGAPVGVLKVADFGLARLMDATRVTKTGTLLGTLHYMSPEQCEGTRSIDARADLYSAGIVLYEMLSGRPPLHADTPVALLRAHMISPPPPIDSARDDVPPDLGRFIADCLAKRPDDRVQTAAAAVERLDALGELPDSRALAAPQPESSLPTEASTRMQVADTTRTVVSRPTETVTATPAAAQRRWLPVAVLLVLATSIGIVVAKRRTAPRGEPTEKAAGDSETAFVLRELAGALRAGDFERFRAACSPALQESVLADAAARERFEVACANEDVDDFHPSGVSGRLDEGRLTVVVQGAVLPAALGMAARDARNGVRLEFERVPGSGWAVRGWQPAKFVAGRDTSGVFAAAERAMQHFVARPENWLDVVRVLGEDRVPAGRRAEIRTWIQRVRSGEAIPPEARYTLKPEQFDADRLIWTVPVDAPQLAQRLGRPGARIELVLSPVREPGRRRLSFTLADARFVD